MAAVRSAHGWMIWASLALALLLSVVPMPSFMDLGRPLWGALFLAYWALAVPHRLGMASAWVFGLLVDVLGGSLLGLNALLLTLIVFLVLSLQRRLHRFPMWQQSLVLLAVFSLAQLVHLWLNALIGNRQPVLEFVFPALVSALLWPWVFAILRGLQRRLGVH